MSWPQAFVSVGAVAITGLAGYITLHGIERRRETASKADKLRGAYGQWHSLLLIAGTDLSVLVGKSNALLVKGESHVARLEKDLSEIRETVARALGVGHEVLALEPRAERRTDIEKEIEALNEIFLSASGFLKAHLERLSIEATLVRTKQTIAGLAPELRGKELAEVESNELKWRVFWATNQDEMLANLASEVANYLGIVHRARAARLTELADSEG